MCSRRENHSIVEIGVIVCVLNLLFRCVCRGRHLLGVAAPLFVLCSFLSHSSTSTADSTRSLSPSAPLSAGQSFVVSASVVFRAEVTHARADNMNSARNPSGDVCKVQGVNVPLFPVGGTEEQVLQWADAFDALAYLSKGAEAFGTENIAWHDLSKEQRAACGVLMGLVMQSCAGHTSLIQGVRAMLAERGQHQHGALARLLLMSFARVEQEEEVTEHANRRNDLLKGVLDPRSSPAQVTQYTDLVITENRALTDDDGRFSPAQLAIGFRGLVPTNVVGKEWDEVRRELASSGEMKNPLAIVNGIIDTFSRWQSKQRLASTR